MKRREVLVLASFLLLLLASVGKTEAEEEGWYFSFACALRDGVQLEGQWRTDGVDVDIAIKESGTDSKPVKLWEKTVAHIGWEKYLLDLSEYAEKTIDVVVTVSAGEQKNSNFDWFILAEPTIQSGSFDPVLSLEDFTYKKATVVAVDQGQTQVLEREEFGSRAFTGSFSSNEVEKKGIYLHPPYKNDVVGTMVFTLDKVTLSLHQDRKSSPSKADKEGSVEHEL